MNQAYLGAFAALAGSAIGALASFGTTWLSLNTQSRAQRQAESKTRKEHLYGEFIEQGSRLFSDAIVHELEGPSTLVDLYALICKLRLFAPSKVLSSADRVLRQIVATYSNTTKEFAVGKLNPDDFDLLREFSEACREDLRVATDRDVLS